MNYKKILIINLGGIGDLVLSSGILKDIRTANPEAIIDFLAAGKYAGFMENYKLFNHVYGLRMGALFLSAAELLKMRFKRYELAVNLRSVVGRSGAFKMSVLLGMINAGKNAGRNTDGFADYYDISVDEKLFAENNESYYDEQLVNMIGFPVSSSPYVPITVDDRGFTEALFIKNGILNEDFIIGVNPGGEKIRRWNLEKFVQLTAKLIDSFECKIVLMGSAADSCLCRRIKYAVNSPKVIDLSGRTTVNQVAELIRRLKIIVTNDTGPMHISVVMGVPGIFIFGGGQIKRYKPFRNPENYAVIQKELPCSPCENKSCTSLECLEMISVDEITKAVLELKKRIYDK